MELKTEVDKKSSSSMIKKSTLSESIEIFRMKEKMREEEQIQRRKHMS